MGKPMGKKLVAAVIHRDGGLSVKERLSRLSEDRGDCRIWTASIDRQGYGRITLKDRRVVRIHRVAWMVEHGPIPDGLVVRHKCDTPGCIRIEHLELGTPTDNVRDMWERGRRSLTGVNNNNARLDEQAVREIRRRAQAGEKQRDIASDFGVTQVCVSSVVRRKTWGHVD